MGVFKTEEFVISCNNDIKEDSKQEPLKVARNVFKFLIIKTLHEDGQLAFPL